MKLYYCFGEPYADGSVNGSAVEHFRSKAEALKSAREITRATRTGDHAGDEVTVGWDIIRKVDLRTACAMLNRAGWSDGTGVICRVVNGRVVSAPAFGSRGEDVP